jgi:hypothetical protein
MRSGAQAITKRLWADLDRRAPKLPDAGKNLEISDLLLLADNGRRFYRVVIVGFSHERYGPMVSDFRELIPNARRANPRISPKSATIAMNASALSALAALAGAVIGGLMSVLASWLTQRTQARAQWIVQDKLRRQELYKEFIEEASKCYIDALQHDKGDIPALVTLYTKIGRMRVLSSPKVIESAEKVGRKILDSYLEPDKTFVELREMVNSKSIDILGEFSEACRQEFESLRALQF